MKTRYGIRIPFMLLNLMVLVTISCKVTGQTTMGILPVNTADAGSLVMNDKEWQGIALSLHDHLVNQMAGVGAVTKLSREHILLLLKELPSPDPENLDPEAYKLISKKERLHYLLRCSIESLHVNGKNVQATIHLVIMDGNNGEMFWEKTARANRMVSDPAINEKILLEEVFYPLIDELSKEIQTLKY